MAIIDLVLEEATDYWSTWSHVFQSSNTTWLAFDQRQIMGNFFIGLQGQTQNAWNAQIPPGSTILSATMEFTPFSNNANPSFDTTMNAPNRAVASQLQDPIQEPFEIFRGWRKDIWTNQTIAVLSTTFTAIAGPSTAPANGAWILNQLVAPGGTLGNRDRMAQRATVRPGPNQTVSFVAYEAYRTGNPTGNLRVRIQGVTLDRGISIPDGVDIAVSSDILASTLVVGSPGGTIGFFFPTTPTLVVGQDYFWIIEQEYVANNADYVSIRHQNQFLTDGQLFHFGDGLGMDWQNHPGDVDLNQAFQTNRFAGEDVIWPIDSVVNGVTETSPDITSLVQAQVDAANYTADAGIIIALSRVVPTAQNRIMAANSNASRPGPILRISYEEPVPVAPTLADPYAGPNRFVEPFDRGYFIWKYGKPETVPFAELQDPTTWTPTQEAPADLEEYIEELDADLQLREASRELEALEATAQAQGAILDQLQQNLVDAKAALEAAKRRRRNNQAAIAVASHLLN